MGNGWSRTANGVDCWTDATSRYEGGRKGNKFHGHGVMTWADGLRYDGNWKDDQLDGRGISTSADGMRYEGIGSVTKRTDAAS